MLTNSLAADWIDTSANVFTAVGTVSAFIMGLALWLQQRRRERRTQARLVYGCVMTETQAAARAAPGAARRWRSRPVGTGTSTTRLIYKIVNGGVEPIYYVDVASREHFPVIYPGSERTAPLKKDQADLWRARKAYSTDAVWPVDFTFTDASNVRWQRTAGGRLGELELTRWGGKIEPNDLPDLRDE